ncbi:amino-acid permease BAT1 homolog isoform X2 [Oryza brachyantha]|uniref:amino-acid permease BAT1 homolog isoform X2 n=1 Tax=Oryza brachyantha TaxID=4533 RepID=UPI001AD9E081|nr:amino-acid permease BAT1 homolog isoform X2 [Oryza brachyantha]
MTWNKNSAAAGVASDADHARLRELGYKQELRRHLSALSNFSISFTILSVLTGVTTLYNTGLAFGGPATMTLGWFVAGAFTMAIGLSMAEICSAFPTSGGLYYWSARLSGERWAPFASWITGWFNIVGQWAGTASVNFSLAQLIQVIVLLSSGGNNGGGYFASKYVVFAFHAGILLSHAIINSLPVAWLSFFGQFATAWNMLGVFVLMIAVPVVATERASARFVFTHFNTENHAGIHSKLYIFVLGLLMSQYTLTGYDASAHMTEETKDAGRSGPIGIISAIGISLIVGWGYILGITFAVAGKQDVAYLLSTDNDAGGYAIAEVFYLAFKGRYGNGAGGIICLGIVAVAVYFCGLSSVTSNSRMIYAFSRDGAMPLSSVWHKVNEQQVPINAVWLSAFISVCMALPPRGVPGDGVGGDDGRVHRLRAADPAPGDAGARPLRPGPVQPRPAARRARGLGRRRLGGGRHRPLLAAGVVPGDQGHPQLHPGRRRRAARARAVVVARQRAALVQGPRHESRRPALSPSLGLNG